MNQAFKYYLLKLYPRILGREREYELENKLCYIDTTKLDFSGKQKVNPWALIRVKNEAITLEASLQSIKDVIHKGVIAYNDCTDGSEEIILRFCKSNPGYIPYKYSHTVKPAGFKLTDLKYEETLAAYSNEALNLIPEGEWFIKIDVDHIYFPEILEQSFYLPKSDKEYVSYSRLDILRTQNGAKIIKYERAHDQLLICKKNIQFINTITKHDDGKVSYFERLNKKMRTSPYCPPCASLHFPFEKKYRNPSQKLINNLISFDEFMNANSKARELPEFITEEFINQASKNFRS